VVQEQTKVGQDWSGEGDVEVVDGGRGRYARMRHVGNDGEQGSKGVKHDNKARGDDAMERVLPVPRSKSAGSVKPNQPTHLTRNCTHLTCIRPKLNTLIRWVRA